MNREPKYGGGAHPKYGSCRGLVSLIPRACISRCPYEVPVVRRRRSYKEGSYFYFRHMVYLVRFVVH